MNHSKAIAISLIAALLAACGGGTKSGSEPPPAPTITTVTNQVQVAISDGPVAQGESVTVTATASERTLTTQGGTTVSDTTRPLAGLLVAFETDAGGFEPRNGVVETNAQGVADLQLLPTAVSGAYAVTASVTVDGETVSASANVTIALENVPSVDVQFPDGADLLAGQPATIVAVATTRNGDPVPDLPLTFASDAGTFSPTVPVVRTDASGIATVEFIPSFRAGLFQISAAGNLNGDTISGAQAFTVQLPTVFFDAPLADPARISAQGQTQVTFNVSTADGPLQTPVDIFLSSICSEDEQASFPAIARTNDGTASITYLATGCRDFDVITAAPFVGEVQIADARQTRIDIDPPSATGIAFIGTEAGAISIAGLDNPTLPPDTELQFGVTDEFGDPARGADVIFELLAFFDPDISLSTTSAVTDNNGIARVRLSGGVRPAAPRVSARIAGTTLTALSPSIPVTTGVPDQNSISLSASVLNIEGWQFDGKVSQLTVRAGDHYQNPVADGTPFLFRSEGGAVVGSCVTENGACQVDLVSQQPRPFDGRVTVLVHSFGDESFTDLDGSGFFESGEPFMDLPEPFLDIDEDGVRGAGEEIIDTDQDGQYDGPDGRYAGLLCAAGNNCQGTGAIDIRDSITLVFSTSAAVIDLPSGVTLDQITSKRVRIEVSDLNGNQMPAGTTIAVTTTNGELGDVSQFTIGNTNAPGPFTGFVSLVGDTEPSTGELTVTVTTPMEVVTRASVAVTDVLNCGFSPQPPECMDDGG